MYRSLVNVTNLYNADDSQLYNWDNKKNPGIAGIKEKCFLLVFYKL